MMAEATAANFRGCRSNLDSRLDIAFVRPCCGAAIERGRRLGWEKCNVDGDLPSLTERKTRAALA